MSSRNGIGGRPSGLIDYRYVSYNDKEYVVGTIRFNQEDKQFVFDKEDYDKINDRAWHFASGNYISSSTIHDSKKKELYLHNLIMDRLEHPGKGAVMSVDHINRNGLDNRKENLRIISQTQQNLNQIKKKRSVILPESCLIKPEDIPRHIWYVRANGQHGERFAIEFKTEGIIWKSTSSKAVSIHDKLKQAKEKLQDFYIQYPYLNPDRDDRVKEINDLLESFEIIIKL
jgi:hypothetical protein